MTNSRIDPATIAELTSSADLVSIALRLGLSLRRSGHEYKALCPFHHEKTPSFFINPRKGYFHCFGCSAHGDAIDLLTKLGGLSFADALRELGGEDLLQGSKAEVHRAMQAAREAAARREEERQAREIGRARELVAQRQPANGTAAERYLAARGLTFPRIPPTLGFVPELRYWHHPEGEERPRIIGTFPALVAAVQNVRGHVTAAHITYLRPDGRDKARPSCPVTGEVLTSRKVRGAAWGGAIRLSPATECAGELGLSEGVESGASASAAVGWDLPVWAAVSLGNLAGIGQGSGDPHPTRRDKDGRPVRLPAVKPDMTRPGVRLPPSVKSILIIADNDGSDPQSARCMVERAARRFIAEQRTVRIAWPPEGHDFNDLWRAERAEAREYV